MSLKQELAAVTGCRSGSCPSEASISRRNPEHPDRNPAEKAATREGANHRVYTSRRPLACGSQRVGACESRSAAEPEGTESRAAQDGPQHCRAGRA